MNKIQSAPLQTDLSYLHWSKRASKDESHRMKIITKHRTQHSHQFRFRLMLVWVLSRIEQQIYRSQRYTHNHSFTTLFDERNGWFFSTLFTFNASPSCSAPWSLIWFPLNQRCVSTCHQWREKSYLLLIQIAAQRSLLCREFFDWTISWLFYRTAYLYLELRSHRYLNIFISHSPIVIWLTWFTFTASASCCAPWSLIWFAARESCCNVYRKQNESHLRIRRETAQWKNHRWSRSDPT